jgi:pimeloyl-ACP methyl ester carboxylesterase
VELCGAKIRARAITFRTEDGVRLVGAALGRGERAVVFANPWGAEFRQGRARPVSLRTSVSGGGLYCAWFVTRRLVDDLVGSGFQLVLFDYRGTGMSGSRRGAAIDRFDLDVAAAVDEARRRLVVISAAPGLDAEPRAIVTLSAKGTAGTKTGRGYGNLDATPAVERLDAPLLLIAAEGERDDVAVARALFAAASMKNERAKDRARLRACDRALQRRAGRLRRSSAHRRIHQTARRLRRRTVASGSRPQLHL